MKKNCVKSWEFKNSTKGLLKFISQEAFKNYLCFNS